jgi:hypothetical protein
LRSVLRQESARGGWQRRGALCRDAGVRSSGQRRKDHDSERPEHAGSVLWIRDP